MAINITKTGSNVLVVFVDGQVWRNKVTLPTGKIVGPTYTTQAAAIEAAKVLELENPRRVTKVDNDPDFQILVEAPIPVDPPPVPVDCVLSAWSDWTVTDWSPCVNGSQSRTLSRTRTIVTPPSNGGAACGPQEEIMTETRACEMPPPPPVDPSVGVVNVRPLNSGSLIVFRAYMQDSTTYERWQHPLIAEGDTEAIQIRAMASLAGDRAFAAQEYSLLIDGMEHVRFKPAALSSIVSVTIRCAELTPGWHMMDCVAVPANHETCIPYFICIKRAGMAEPTTMPVVQSSYDGRSYDKAMWAMVPAKFDPTILPLPARTPQPFSEPLTRRSLFVEETVPARKGDIYRPRVTKGILNTGNEQNYTINPLWAKFPDKALVDGPRGKGTVNGVTSLFIGHAVYWFTDAWSFGKVKYDGTVERLVGIRSRVPAGRNRDNLASDFELVGDWSRIPVERRGFGGDGWGFAWIPGTLPNDPHAAPVLFDGVPLQPHFVPPQVLITDTQNNRIIRATFSNKDQHAPGIVEEFITGLADPWDCVCTPDDMLIVSERRANKITMWNARTGAFVKTLVQGPDGYAVIDKDIGGSQRKCVRLNTLDAIRAQTCIMPEGLAYLDGWCYFGSLAMQQIKRVNVATGELQTLVNCDDRHVSFVGAQYVKIAVSDGTFGPRGAMAAQFWTSNDYAGAPVCYLPDGTVWQVLSPIEEGPGHIIDYEYGSAVAFGRGRMVFSASIEGLFCVTKSQPGDPSLTWDGGHHAGWMKWKELGLTLTHGNAGFGYYGLLLPWGRTPDTDRLMEGYGFTRAG